MTSTFNTLLMEEKKQIRPFKVDGKRETTSGEEGAYEFHGCLWHGCSKCFSRRLWTKYDSFKINDFHLKAYGIVKLIRNVKLTKT